MRTYEEQEKRAYEKAELLLEQNKRRRAAIIRRSAALAIGTAAVLGVGLTTFVLRPPKMPSPVSSGIITETTASATASDVGTTQPQTSAEAVSTAAGTGSGTVSATAPVQTGTSTQTSAATSRTAAQTQPTTGGTRTTATATQKTTANTTTAGATSTANETTAAPTTSTWSAMTTGPSMGDLTYDDMLMLEFARIEPFGGKTYTNKCDIAPERVGAYIKDMTFVPTVYRDKLPAQVNAQIFEVKNVSTDWAAAIKFEGSENYRVMYNREAQPDTLGELIDALDLQNDLNVIYGRNGQDKYSLDNDRVWELLFSDRDIPRETGYIGGWHDYDAVFEIPLFETAGTFFGVGDNGYMWTNISSSGAMVYYIGKDKAQQFRDYLLSCPKI